jgi:2-C-methyl-D-erythritol 2,4-cyclodiphosphate synthase
VGEPRVGLGFDVHPPEPGRPLYLAGVEFEGVDGLAGHSDADVVCHALADAVLGASGLGDIGEHFPESDPDIAGVAGLDLLRRVMRVVRHWGFRVTSCDLTVLAERPSIAPERDRMRFNLAEVLDLDAGHVSVKATRPEGLGLRGDGIGCIAVAVLAEP